jgi:hypothetical protein
MVNFTSEPLAGIRIADSPGPVLPKVIVGLPVESLPKKKRFCGVLTEKSGVASDAMAVPSPPVAPRSTRIVRGATFLILSTTSSPTLNVMSRGAASGLYATYVRAPVCGSLNTV